MLKKIKEMTYSDKRSLQERKFILAGIIGCLSILAVLLSVITTNQSVIFAVILSLTFIVFLGIISFTIRTKRFNLGGSLIILISNLMILPIGYLLGGGVFSGAPLWFVVGMVFVFVLFRGKLFWMYFILTFLSFGVSFYIGATHPEWVVSLDEGYSIHTDAFIAAISVSVLCGLLFKFQSMVLEHELKKAEDQKIEIERLNEAQSSFFSSMSHEIRTPINTIIGLNEMTMREPQLPNEILENTLNIQNASKMLLSLINDILDMSKIQSGNMQIVPAAYETSHLLSEITNLHWNRASEKNLRFEIQIGEDIPSTLYGDDTRIKQIITNLLTNAIKYTEEGYVIMRFGGERVNDNKYLLQVEIEDSGINIQYLFDTFRRIEGSDTKNIEGTGLGLSISKQLVDMMDGKISVNSIYTKGSTFRVEIPQEIVNSKEMEYRTPGIVAKVQPDYHQSFEAPKATVLIVDDNDMNRIVCRKLLRSTRVQVDLAESGRECLEKTREKHYDAIFMDHEMPQMDGIEALRRLRQQPDGLCRNTPVVALTANAGSDKEAFYQEQGFSAYISKPIQSSRLEAILLACLPEDLIEQNFTKNEEETLNILNMVQQKPFIITTDSIADLTEEIISKYEIMVMPYYIQTDQGRFRDKEEIDATNLQQYILNGDHDVHSMPASVEEYEKFFGTALSKARKVIHLSAMKNISRAYDNAVLAAESFGNVQVVDSGMLSSGIALMVIRASELLQRGIRTTEVLQDLERYRKKISINYLVPAIDQTNSKYHLPIFYRMIINSFNLEPSFTIKRGKLAINKLMMGYVRTTSEQFIKICLSNPQNINTKRLFVTFSGCSRDDREHILQEIQRYVQFDEIIVNKASAATFINCGPNSFGLAYERKDKK